MEGTEQKIGLNDVKASLLEDQRLGLISADCGLVTTDHILIQVEEARRAGFYVSVILPVKNYTVLGLNSGAGSPIVPIFEPNAYENLQRSFFVPDDSDFGVLPGKITHLLVLGRHYIRLASKEARDAEFAKRINSVRMRVFLGDSGHELSTINWGISALVARVLRFLGIERNSE